jgi:hypothetical protein
MKGAELLRSTIFALGLAAAGPVVGARADVITLDVSASVSAFFGSAACSPACTLGGDIVINNSAPAPGAIVSEDVTMAGETPSVGPFTTTAAFGQSIGLTLLVISDSAGDLLDLFFATPTAGSLVGYTGGPISTDTEVVNFSPGARWDQASGSLTERVAVPAPLIGHGLSALLAVGGLLFGAKFLERTKKRRSLGTQPA